jgi:hypothetical protein
MCDDVHTVSAGGLLAGVLACEDVSFVLVGSAALELRGALVEVNEADIVLRAEEGELAPVPVGLVNGNLHAGGRRPPFEAPRVLRAIESLRSDPSLSDRKLRSLIGHPTFPVGCVVQGNLAALFAGRPCALRLLARVQVDHATRTIVIDRIPPGAGIATAAQALAHRSELHKRHEHYRLELQRTAGLPLQLLELDEERVVCEPESGVDLEGFVEQLLTIYPIQTRVHALLPAPLPTILRNWVEAFGSEDIEASFAAIAESFEVPGWASNDAHSGGDVWAGTPRVSRHGRT